MKKRTIRLGAVTMDTRSMKRMKAKQDRRPRPTAEPRYMKVFTFLLYSARKGQMIHTVCGRSKMDAASRVGKMAAFRQYQITFLREGAIAS